MITKKNATKPLQLTDVLTAAEEPTTGLPVLIRLANMAPSDTALPCFPDLKCIGLGWYDMVPAAREREFERFLNENFPRERFADLRRFFDDGLNDPFRPVEMYAFLKETREALTMIASQQQQQSLFNLTSHFPWHLLGGWKIDRIRICENCGRLFFADRGNKLTCKPECSTARRVREWRKKQSQYEQARKLKVARPAKKNRQEEPMQKGGKSNGTQKTR